MYDTTDPNTPSWAGLSRRCLWGWAAPRGRYAKHASSGTVTAMPMMKLSFRPAVRPRNLTGQADVYVDICIAYRGDTGAGIKFTAGTSGSTYTWSPAARTSATPTVVRAIAQLYVDGAGDEITIEVRASTTAAFEIFAIGIFETAASIAI